MNNIYIVYRGELPDEYTIEDKYLQDEIESIKKADEITAAFLNDERIK